MRKAVLILAVLMSIVVLASCKQDPASPSTPDVVKPTSYKITFNANGGAGTMEEKVVSIGDSITLPRGAFTSADNEQFVGWNTKADYTGDIYTDEEKFVPTSDLTLYAQWVPENFFGITADGELYRGAKFDTMVLKNNFAVPKYIDDVEVITFRNGVNSGVSYSPNGLFQYCYYLKAVAIPDSVTGIGDYAFHSCSALTSVSLPDSITSIGASSFTACYVLEAIEFPENLESIGNSAFYNCHLLNPIVIPDSVQSIGSSAFSSCKSFSTITLPQGITEIPSYAFDRCSHLKTVIFKGEVTSIGNLAFRYCSALETVSIPATVETINTAAFYICTSLKAVYLEAATPPTLMESTNPGEGMIVFGNTDENLKIYVPAASVNTYKAADSWSTYADRIQAMPAN